MSIRGGEKIMMYYYHLIEYVMYVWGKSFSKVTKRYIKVIYKKLETSKMLGKRRSSVWFGSRTEKKSEWVYK